VIRKRTFAVAVAFTIVGLIIGLAISSNLGIQTNGYSTLGSAGGAKGSAGVSKGAVDALKRVSEALVEVVDAVRPSVVNISTTKRVRTRSGGPGQFFDDPFFRRFFGEDFFRNFGQPRERKETNLGSGIIVDKKGYILTNNHVVKDAEEIIVTLYDKREFKGEVIGMDPKTDLAVIKIKEDDLPVARLGDSEKLRVGEMVIAVGSPYGLSHTVTTGIVSAKGRANVRISDYEDFIQTDAAINPGNSGGPLINIKGEVVGINTAIFSTSGGYQGIGFAIPVSMANVVMESLIKEGKVTRGWLGVTIQPITRELAEQFGLKDEQGTLVSDVFEGSPADEAGVKRGDIIVRYNGREVDEPNSLRNMVAATPPGKEVDLAVVREETRVTLSVKIGELPGEKGIIAGRYENVLKGVHVQDLTPDIRKNFGIPEKIKGVVVAYVEEDIGLRRGDVVLEINRKPVEDVKQYDKAVSRVKAGSDVLLLVYRDGGAFYLPVSGK
jgi:serine protease Do